MPMDAASQEVAAASAGRYNLSLLRGASSREYARIVGLMDYST